VEQSYPPQKGLTVSVYDCMAVCGHPGRNLENLNEVVASPARSVLSGRADPRFPVSNAKRPSKGSKWVGYDVLFTFHVTLDFG
jgi:hypothetical protein